MYSLKTKTNSSIRDFKDLGIKTALQKNFTGEKIRIDQVLNKPIVIHDFKIEDSKFGKGNEKCLYMQITVDGVMRLLFTGSLVLMQTIQDVKREDFPFTTTIVKNNKRTEFS